VIAADADLAGLAAALTAAGLPFTSLGDLGAGPEAEPAEAGPRLTLVPVTLAKGLEFDHVIVVEPGHIAGAEARGLHRLYVALTRAVSRLTVLHTSPLPAALLPTSPS